MREVKVRVTRQEMRLNSLGDQQAGVRAGWFPKPDRGESLSLSFWCWDPTVMKLWKSCLCLVLSWVLWDKNWKPLGNEEAVLEATRKWRGCTWSQWSQTLEAPEGGCLPPITQDQDGWTSCPQMMSWAEIDTLSFASSSPTYSLIGYRGNQLTTCHLFFLLQLR